MFADRLNQEESEALVELLVFIAHADGRLDPEEVAFIEAFARARGVTARIDSPPADLEQATARLRGRAAQVVALQELVRIGLCDGRFDEAERRGVERIAAACGLEPEIVPQTETWVRDGLAWVGRGEAMLAGSEQEGHDENGPD